jgi:hypothetical protein
VRWACGCAGKGLDAEGSEERKKERSPLGEIPSALLFELPGPRGAKQKRAAACLCPGHVQGVKALAEASQEALVGEARNRKLLHLGLLCALVGSGASKVAGSERDGRVCSWAARCPARARARSARARVAP